MLRAQIFRLLPKLLFVIVGLMIVILLLLYSLKLIEPSSPPQNIFLSNITDHQASISWTTVKPTKGLIVISEDGKFPLLPTFAQKTYKDDGEKNLKRAGFYTTHHITIGELSPNKTYQYLIYQGWKKMIGGSFTTSSALTFLPAPNPVYGKVVATDKQSLSSPSGEVKKTPIVGAIVYLQVIFKQNKSALISTLTNQEGGWSLDLGNLRTKDLKMSYPLSSASAELIVVEAGAKGRVQANTKVGKDKPWANIVLSPQSKNVASVSAQKK